MRDVTHLREKLEISLDDRQVAALVVAALLLLGGVFALGLLAGKRLAASAPQASAVGDLQALDEQQKREAAAPKPVLVPLQPSAPPGAEPTPAAGAEPTPAAAAAKDDDEGIPESGKPPEELPPARPQKVAQATPVETPAGSPEPARAPAVIPAPRPATVVEKPARPAQVQSAAAIVLTMPPRDPGDFTVQIGASQERSEAQRLEKRARGAGLKPYVVEVNLGAKGIWYRVRVGAFKDKDKAARFRRDVERELRSTAVVMSTR